MCGIAGIISTDKLKGEQDRRKFFKAAMIVSSMRGTDSAGMMMIPHSDAHDTIIYKRAISPYDFVDTAPYHDAMIHLDRYLYTIGHTRAATIGKVRNVTAHPFTFGDTNMVHNGTLTNWRTLVQDSYKFESDSEALCYLIDQEGIDATLKKIQGSFAIVWNDQANGTLHMVRNDERPLHFATVAGQETVVLASEYGMLKWLMERHEFEVENIYEVTPGHVITLDPQRDSIKKWSGRKVEFAPTEKWRDGNYYRNQNKTYIPPKTKGGGSTNTYANEAGRMAELRKNYPQGTFVRFSISGVNTKFGQKEGTVDGWTTDGSWTHVASSTQFRTSDVDENMIYKGKVQGYHMTGGSWPTLKLRKCTVTNDKYEQPSTKSSKPDWVEDEDPTSLEDLIVGPNGSLVNEATFLSMVRYGCVFCQLSIDAMMADEIDWIKNDDGVQSPICERCVMSNTEEVK